MKNFSSTYQATCYCGSHVVTVRDAGFSATSVSVSACPSRPAVVVRKSAAPAELSSVLRHRTGLVEFEGSR